jgi:hypothetical protein
LRIRSRELGQRITELGMDAIAHYAAPFQPEARAVDNPEPAIGPDYGVIATPLYLSQRASTIAGGTPDIQHNNVARALLGL